MSYCRLSDSDAYIIDHCDGFTRCYWCKLTGDNVDLYTLEEAIAHVQAHRAAGHDIPAGVEDEMRQEEADDPGWRAPRP